MNIICRLRKSQALVRVTELVNIAKKKDPKLKKSNGPFYLECNYSEGKRKIENIVYADCYISSDIIGKMRITINFERQENNKKTTDTIVYTYQDTNVKTQEMECIDCFQEKGLFNKYANLFITVYNNYK